MTNDGRHRTLDVVNYKADVCGVFDVFLSKFKVHNHWITTKVKYLCVCLEYNQTEKSLAVKCHLGMINALLVLYH